MRTWNPRAPKQLYRYRNGSLEFVEVISPARLKRCEQNDWVLQGDQLWGYQMSPHDERGSSMFYGYPTKKAAAREAYHRCKLEISAAQKRMKKLENKI